MSVTHMPHRPGSRLAGAWLLAGALLVGACAAGATAVPTAPQTAAPRGSAEPTIAVTSVQDSKLGAHLAGAGGKTLYVFTKDSAGKSTCTGSCPATWPPLLLPAGTTLAPASGVTGAFGTTTREDVTIQVTYAGAPLYYYAGDTKAGDVMGQGFSSLWYVAATAGGPGGRAAASPASPAAPASPGSSEEYSY